MEALLDIEYISHREYDSREPPRAECMEGNRLEGEISIIVAPTAGAPHAGGMWRSCSMTFEEAETFRIDIRHPP
jgi:hypothetical protein